jgi:hypothetical protein
MGTVCIALALSYICRSDISLLAATSLLCKKRQQEDVLSSNLYFGTQSLPTCASSMLNAV